MKTNNIHKLMARLCSFFLLSKMINIRMKISFFILIASTAFSLAQITNPPDSPVNYDITTQLNNSVSRTFQNLNSDVIQELIHNMETDNPISFDTGVNHDYKPFQNEFFFTGVNISVLNLQSVHVRHIFSSVEMTIFIPKLALKIEGYLGATNDTVHAGFVRSVIFENISIITFKLPHHLPGGKLYIYMKYDENFESNCIYSPWFHQDIISETRFELERKIKETLPSLFLYNLKHNEKFSRSINATFCNHPAKEFASLYPDFLNNTDRFHYIIPNITSLQRTLSNITISGLWNFISHSFSVNLGQTITNLMIKNIRGHANLSYDTQNLTIFPLRFEAGLISILVDGVMKRVSVTAYNYSVSQINSNISLTEYQSKWVMGGIELAIAASIMPSFKVYRTQTGSSNILDEHPIVKISAMMSQHFEGKTIQKLYSDWNISMPENMTAESTLQLESSEYNISISSSPTQAFIPSPYPNWIQCNLYDTLRITFGLPWYLFGKIRLSNSTHQLNDIDFMMGDFFSGLVKRNNSNETDDFEPVTVPRIDVQLLSESNEHNFTENHTKAIIEKTKQMMTSSISKVIMLLAKPLLSLPLDHCTAPVKLFDDFLPFLIDDELSYYVPNLDNTPKTEQFFTSKINNVVIQEWSKTPNIWISFYDDADENIESIVNTELGMTKVRMNFNDSSVQSDDLEFVFRSTVLKNFTDTGEIVVHFYYDHEKYPVRNNISLSARESYWLKGKLEYITAESFKNLTKIE